MATDFHLTEKNIQINNIFPWVWKETAVANGLGEYYALSLWAQPLHTFFGLLASLNIPFTVQTKLLGLGILILGFWGVWKLMDKFNINNCGKSVGSVFFLLNSFFLLLFDGGQLSLALAYSTIPIVLFYFLKTIESDQLADKLKFLIWLLVLSIFDIRIIYLIILVVLMLLIFKSFIRIDNSLILLKRAFLSIVFAMVTLIGFHAFWLLPAIIAKPIQLPETYDRTSQVNFLSFSSLQHSMLLQQPHWPKNIFGKITSPNPEFIFIPLIVFSVLLIKRGQQEEKRSNEIIGFWLLVSVVSIFLSKGSNEPFPQIYSILFTYVPGFSLFRDSAKFYFLICLSYSILIAFFVHAITSMKTEKLLSSGLIKVVQFLIILYFILLVRPVYLNQMTGMFSFPNLQNAFERLADILRNNTDESRIFWIPMKSSLGYVDVIHPSVQATELFQKRPFAVGAKGTYETFNFLREAPYMGEVFDVTGIGYIVYPNLDSRRDNMHPDNIRYYYTFLDQLSKRTWLMKVDSSPIPLLKTKQHQDKFFVAPNLWWVIGSDSIYNEATKSANLKLAKNALIFAEESAGLGRRIDELPDVRVVLNHKTNLDLAASLIDSSDLIFPAKNLDFEPGKSGWWKREAADLIRWRSFLQEKYGIDNQDFDLGGGWAVGERNSKFKIQNSKLKKGKKLLARVMESSRSGSLKFYQDNQLVGELQTGINGDANVRWFEIGELASNKELTLQTSGDINVVNALAILDENTWFGYQKKARIYQDQGRIVNFNEKNTEILDASVVYQQVNPTKYKTIVKGLKNPAFLVFSQNFDGLWKLKDQKSIPVYSLLNGFRIEKDGEYIIEFEAQKYVNIGLIITFVTLLSLGSLAFWLRRKG